MSFSQYLLGAAEMALIAAALCLGAYYLRSVLAPSWTGALARLAEAILAITGLVVASELVGVVGLFEPGFIVAACVALGFGVAACARGREPLADLPAPPVPPVSPWMVAVGAVAAFVVVVHWAMPTQQALDIGMYSQDTIWYHMSFAGRFAQDAQVGPVQITDPLKVVSWFYPQNSELIHGVGIASFHHDVLSPLLNLGWLSLCLLAAWCIGRPYGLGPLTLVAAVIVLDTPMMVEQAGNGPSDTIALFFLLAALALLVNLDAGRRGPAARASEPLTPFLGSSAGATGPLFIAALAAGLAIGTKITLLATIGALTLGVLWLGRSQLKRVAVVWIGGLAIPSIFWYARNTVEAHNPLPWVQKGPLPGPDQLDLYPRKPHTVAHYATDTHVWKAWFFHALDDRLGPIWFLLLAAAIGALVYLVFRGRTPMLRVLAGVGIVACLAYVFTPLSAAGAQGSPSGFAPNLRYFSPGFAAGLVLLPLVLVSLGGTAEAAAAALKRNSRLVVLVFGGLVAAFLVGTIVQITFNAPHFSQAEIQRIATEGQTGFRSFAQDSYESAKLPGALLLAAALVLVPLALLLPSSKRSRRLIAGAGSVAVVAVILVLGWHQSRDYVRDRYDTTLANPFEREAGFRASTQWKQIQQWGRVQKDTRIGVVGRAAAFGQYVFYGPDISNHVQYVADEIPNGGSRPIDSCLLWRRDLNAGHYDYVVITPRLGNEAFSTPPEIAWTTDKNSQAIISTGPAAVFKLNGPLDIAGCAPATASTSKARAKASA
jgi:4-amino-4-deoxy-L-arabinose transferase-like glycosyltransferase